MMHTKSTNVPKIIILLLFIAWILPGLIGRDLWKADEPYSFGLVNHMVKSGDFVVPTLADEPFLEKPPILYLTASMFVRVSPHWLKPHDAARLATGFFMALAALFTALAARELNGKGYGTIGLVILIGCSGLQETAHKLITDVALLAGFAIGLYGLLLTRRRPSAGVWLGIGAGVGFLAKGLLAPGILGIIALMMPLVSKEWRNKAYGEGVLIAFIVALPLVIVWPLALYVRSPKMFIEWFWYQNFGRFVGFANSGVKASPFYYLKTLPWFALPVLPLALRTLWINRRSWRLMPASVLFPLTAFLVMLTVLSLSFNARDLYALPMLLPLSLLATAGMDGLGERARARLTTLTIVFFGLVALALWIGWFAMIIGRPLSIAHELRALQPGYTPHMNGLLFSIGLLYTVVFALAIVRFRHNRYCPVFTWTTGMTLLWALLMTIWLPWLDAGAGYRVLLTSLRDSLPESHGVIASQGIGESERALLEYYAGIVTKRIEVDKENMKDTDLLLIEEGGSRLDPPEGYSWRLLWEARRHKKEAFRLYVRAKGNGSFF